jgi:predicted PurR-regulated permease PerM
LGSVSDGIKKQWRLILFILALVVIVLSIWFLRGILLPFIIGFVFAFILLPFIRWFERRLPVLSQHSKLKQFLRVGTILIVYILILGIIGLFIFYIVYAARQTLSNIDVDINRIAHDSLENIMNWVKSIPFLSSPSLQNTIDTYFQRASDALPGIFVSFLTGSLKVLQTSAQTIISFLITPVFMFLILKDWEKIRDGYNNSVSPWLRRHTKGVFDILQDVVVRYIRGQLFLGMIVGSLSYIMLLIMGIDFALPLAVFSGITELVPMIGPWVGGALGVLVTLAVAPDKAIWVALGYLIIQLLENLFLVPRVQGRQMNINPAFVIVLTVLGAYFAGILGFIIVLPATMMIIRLFKYFRDCTRETVPVISLDGEDYISPDEM